MSKITVKTVEVWWLRIYIGFMVVTVPLYAYSTYDRINAGDYETAGAYAVLYLFAYAVSGACTYYVCKERIMRLGVFERIREKRRLAMAAAVAEKYSGVDLLETEEARKIPHALYPCELESCYRREVADRMYWIDLPLVPAGWYCDGCADDVRDLDKYECLNMGVFLTVLDYETSRIDRQTTAETD